MHNGEAIKAIINGVGVQNIVNSVLGYNHSISGIICCDNDIVFLISISLSCPFLTSHDSEEAGDGIMSAIDMYASIDTTTGKHVSV